MPVFFEPFLTDIQAGDGPYLPSNTNGNNFHKSETTEPLDHHSSRRGHTPVNLTNHDIAIEQRAGKLHEVVVVSCVKSPRLFDGKKLPLTGPSWAGAFDYAKNLVTAPLREVGFSSCESSTHVGAQGIILLVPEQRPQPLSGLPQSSSG